MTEIKQEQLNKATGGYSLHDQFVLGKRLSLEEIGDYIGFQVVVSGGSEYLAYGTLMKYYEESWGCGTRETVEIKDHPNCVNRQNKSTEGYSKCFVDTCPIYLIEKILY